MSFFNESSVGDLTFAQKEQTPARKLGFFWPKQKTPRNEFNIWTLAWGEAVLW